MATINRDRNRLTVDSYGGATYRELAFALRGEKSPCMATASDVWTSDNPQERKMAAEACRHCPAIRECYKFARATRTEFGVYGGTDFTTH